MIKKLILILALLASVNAGAQTFTGTVNATGGNVVTNNQTNATLGGNYTGTNLGGSNSLGVSGIVSATGGGTPYANNCFTGVPNGFSTWAAYGGVYSSTNMTNDVNWLLANAPQLLHQPVPYVMAINAGWSLSSRDANGRLQWNTTYWGDTPTNYINYLHANGLMGILYLQDAASGGWPQTIGTNIEFDAQTIATWGWDGLIYDRILTSTTAAWWPMLLRAETAFKQVSTNRNTIFWTDAMNFNVSGFGLTSDSDLGLLSGMFSGTVFASSTDLLGAAYPYGQYLYLVTNASIVVNMGQLSSTHNWVSATTEQPNNWSAQAMGTTFFSTSCFFGLPNFATALSKSGVQGYQTYFFTNSAMYALQNDPLRSTPSVVQGLGSWTTNQVLQRPLANGDTAVLVWNCSTNTTYTSVINFTNLGLATNTIFQIVDVFDCTNYAITSNTISVTVTNLDCRVLRFHPLTTTTLNSLAQDTNYSYNYANYNFFIGQGVGNLSLTGVDNTGVGVHTLTGLTSGGDNDVIGRYAGNAITTGNNNVGMGTSVFQNRNPTEDVAIGFNALLQDGGSLNTAVGFVALNSIVSGTFNIGIGYPGGNGLTSGSESSNIDIGNTGTAGESGIIRIGTTGNQTATYLTGVVNGNGNGLTNLDVTVSYPTGTTGFTNGSGGGLALSTNHYYTNQFSTAIHVYLYLTNSAASAVGAVYPFQSSGTARQSIPYSDFALTSDTPIVIPFILGQGEWFAITNTTGIYQVKTNEVQLFN